MEYQSFDPSGCGFPRPHVPVLPGMGRYAWKFRIQPAACALTRAPNARFYSRGRYALTEAFRLCGVGPASTLLAPAYHCRTMLDPAIRLGARVELYPLSATLAPDLDGLRVYLHTCDRPPAALLLTHFFGFEQSVDPVLALCEAHGMALIEDCSHCLFLPGSQSGPGLRGRYAVASPYKFFPMEDGGTLWANQGAALPTSKPMRPGLGDEIKGLTRVLQRATARRTPLPTAAVTEMPSPVQLRSAAGRDARSHQNAPSHQYDPTAEHLGSLAISRWALCHTDTRRLSIRRRDHYRTWVNAVARLPYCRALQPDLQEYNTPYMFPLLLEHPHTHFHALKRLGVPVWRWDDMAVSECAVAMQYRTRLLHLPCHQELTNGQMEWMIHTLARVMELTPMAPGP